MVVQGLLLLTTYSRGKTDPGTSLLAYPRIESAGCCRILAGAQPLFENCCLQSRVWLALVTEEVEGSGEATLAFATNPNT